MVVGGNTATYKILRLTTPTINIGGKPLKVGDTFTGTKDINWTDQSQAMEVMDVDTHSKYKLSAKVFQTKGAVKTVMDFLLKTNQASSRDNEMAPELKKSQNASQYPESRIALVIGNSNYENLKYLRNAQKDAVDVSESLLSLGFDVVEAYEVNYEDMMTALNKFASLAKNYDVALFYYAGHGTQYEGKNYLLPINFENQRRSELDRTLHADDVLQRIENSGVPVQLVFIDACRNINSSWTRDSSEGLARMEGGIGSVIVFSTQSGKTADDGEGDNSPFAASLINNLSDPVSFSETMTNVVKDTYEITDHQQYPLVVGSLINDFRFNPSGNELKKVDVYSYVPSPSQRNDNVVSKSKDPIVKNSQEGERLLDEGKLLLKKFRFEEAAKCFQQAADAGNAEANYYLGEQYYNGNGVKKSFPTAKSYYKEAADAGFASAQYMMGVMARNGQGGDKNLKEARAWLEKAAAQGNKQAEKMLKQL